MFRSPFFYIFGTSSQVIEGRRCSEIESAKIRGFSFRMVRSPFDCGKTSRRLLSRTPPWNGIRPVC